MTTINGGHVMTNRKLATKLIGKVSSLGDLLGKAALDPRYAQLALLAASNLGGSHDPEQYRSIKDVANAMRWLRMNAQETSERGVIAEVNAVRDLVTVTETEF